MSVVLLGSTSGSVTLQEPAVAGSTVIDLPATSGTMAVSGGTITTLTTTSGISVQGLTVGRGAGAVSTNTAVGASALQANTSGAKSVAVGYQAGYSQTAPAASNIYVGHTAGYTNVTGQRNVYIGETAAYSATGSGNTILGYAAGNSLTTGSNNTFIGGRGTGNGEGAGWSITTGSNNTIIGQYGGNSNGLDIRTSNNYIVLSDGDGNPRLFFTSDGSFNVATAYSATTANAANLNIGSDGYFRRSTSSLKYKRDVQDATHGLAEVLQLRPVTYKGKDANDGDTVFGGLIAEEVHEIGLTEFVQYADDGSPDALAYGNMVSLCIKAIQELKAEIDALKGTA